FRYNLKHKHLLKIGMIRLKRVICNIFINALEQMSEPGVISFSSLQLSNGTIQLTISNTGTYVPKEKLEPVIKKGFEKLAKSSNCILDDTYYLNGEYDFLTIFKAKNLQDAKKFQEEFNRLYIGFIQKTQLFEVLFPLRVKGIFNPNAEKLAEFF
ncbi:MAG: hypothetical protein QHH15_04365, partial [Candidatus Thermoplasmatota archaeon]|nr:hypothetical protein [Candidatus Thermoplasmatota archaeon]